MYATEKSAGKNTTANDFPEFRRSLLGQEIFIILGSQGSGTNLLCRILRRVFKFSVVQDRALILKSAIRVNKNPERSLIQREVDHVYRSLFPGSIRKRFDLNHYYHQGKNYKGIEKFLHDSEIRNAKEFVDFFYDYHAFIAGGRHKAIKSDDISELFDELNEEIFPKKKYLLLLRDPRDNALSIANKDFGPCHLYFASLFVKEKLLLHEQETQRDPDSTLAVHYETLLSNPQEFVDNFSERFKIAPLGDLSEQPIRKENFNKWMRLPERELELCETVLKDEIERFGYTLKTEAKCKFSSKDLLSWRLHELAMRVPQRASAQIKNLIKP